MQQHRMVRALHLQEMASSLSAEAATWRLLWHLYGPGTRAYPGGAGGPQLPSCAGAPTLAQQIAAILEQDAVANRCTYRALHVDQIHARNSAFLLCSVAAAMQAPPIVQTCHSALRILDPMSNKGVTLVPPGNLLCFNYAWL